MSVRPITNAEIYRAYGQPWATYAGIFFSLQGVLAYMSMNKITAADKFFTQKGQFPRFLLLTVGGYYMGKLLVQHLAGDQELMRLHKTHLIDQEYGVYDEKKFE
ncbi:unnamed protein product [Moneuplotes crassus]|uniref:Uncharacterized protein n=2 Tax=Euplotes crassus TaxID=5936 RepID=A0AAD1Y4H9_EUPCR|nr:unnamed protein product [Moneuplotes crassus]